MHSQTTNLLFAIGINHKTADIALREKFFLGQSEKALLLSFLKNDPSVLGAFVLSTCNRTEIYAHLLNNEPRVIFDTIYKVKKIETREFFEKNFYCFKNDHAVRQLFCVAAGLDSLVLGEKQILGQVKEAAQTAHQMGMMTRELNILANLAIRAGKKAQTETEIGFGGSSISWAAVETLQIKLNSLAQKSILVIGAGKMGHLAAEQLRNKNVGTVYVANRSCDKSAIVAKEIQGTAVNFWELKETLEKVDACICSAGAPHYLIETELMKSVMTARLKRPIVLIDISMPRNIEPSVRDIPGVTLASIDDLDQIVEENAQRRLSAVNCVNEIIEKKIFEFNNKVSRAREFEKSIAT